MQAVTFEDSYVFLYQSMLFTRSPLLKEVYCESHRLEPWAVRGEERRLGRYVFPNVLYVGRAERDALLTEIPRRLEEDPSYPQAVRRRFEGASRALARRLLRTRAGDVSAQGAAELIELTCRVLSSGVFKEVLEPERALELLGAYLPVEPIRPSVLALYQPLCLPHFLKFELKLLYFAQRWAELRDRRWVRRCIDQAAHLSRFLVEETPFDEPATMRAKLEELVDAHGGAPARLARRRLALLRNHARAVRRSLLAERDVLQRMDEAGRYSLRSRRAVMGILRFVQFISTYEELKHIQTVQAAKAIRRLLRRAGLAVEETTRERLLAKLGRARPAR